MKVILMTKLQLNKTEQLINALDEFQIEFVTSDSEITVQKDQTTHSVTDAGMVKNLIEQLRMNDLFDLNVMVDTGTQEMEFIIDEI